MLENNKEEYIWCEKWRPTRISDIILEEDVKKKFDRFLSDKEFPHLLFFGTPGTGKSTVAKALCEELGKEYLFINASLDSNIDTLKEKIQQFARTISLGEGKKVIILDEIDGVRSVGFFDGLRPVIERFSKNCVFIMTCNNKEKIPEAIQSRPLHYEFTVHNKKEYAKMIMRKVSFILKKEGIEFDRKIVGSIIKYHFPDIRRVINSLQQQRDHLNDPNVLYRLEGADIKPLIDAMSEGDVKLMKQYIMDNINVSYVIYSRLYKNLSKFIENETIPNAILILDDYQRSHSFCVDQELHLIAMLVEIGSQCKFKRK